ncbi:MAG: hypothetical protein E7370_06450 [Clostridiales bacterium]|nr:hypothetical protein [Clostridiales bacterium]
MRLCVVYEGQIKSPSVLPRCDIAVFGFEGLGEIDYESEISGKTDALEEAARLSRLARCAVVGGCVTCGRGLLRKSACVFDNGKLIGICDMAHVLDGEKFKAGCGVGVYNLGGYKVGIVVENDLLFPEVFKTLSHCGCNLFLVLLSTLCDGMPPQLIRSYSYLYGIPTVMCAGKTAYFADTTGAIATSKQAVTLFESDMKNDYHLVSTR